MYYWLPKMMMYTEVAWDFYSFIYLYKNWLRMYDMASSEPGPRSAVVSRAEPGGGGR